MSYLYPAGSEGSVFYRESSEAGLITNDQGRRIRGFEGA